MLNVLTWPHRSAAPLIAGLLLTVATCELRSQTKSIPIHAWVTGGLGSSTFSSLPSVLVAGWLDYKGISLGVRPIDSDPGINVDELIDRSVLLGRRLVAGRMLLVGAAGISHTTGELSNGEQSGTTTPIEPEYAPAAHAELSFALAEVVGIGAAVFWTGGSRSRNAGGAIVLQLGFLR